MYEPTIDLFTTNITNKWGNIIIEENDINKKITLIKSCNGDNGYFTITESMKNKHNDIIYPGIIYTGNHEWVNGNMKLNFNNGRLLFYLFLNTPLEKGYSHYWSSHSHSLKDINNTLRMQYDGNLVIYNKDGKAVWSSKTSGNIGAYGKIDAKHGGFSILNSDNTIIKYLLTKSSGSGFNNIFITESDNKNWKYCKNNSKVGFLSNFVIYYNTRQNIAVVDGITRFTDNQPWGMTESATSDNERDKSDMIKTINMKGYVDEIAQVVLMNFLGERIYIEPELYEKINNHNDYSNSGWDWNPKCNENKFSPTPALTINNFIDALSQSASKLANGIFSNERGKGPISSTLWGGSRREINTRNPFEFFRDFGAWAHTSSPVDGCTQFYALYDDNRHTQFKQPLYDERFLSVIPNTNKKDGKNWFRWNRGASQYDRYWRVFIRTLDGYVSYLNSDKSPFTNKKISSVMTLQQSKKSNFINKLHNSYLESIQFK